MAQFDVLANPNPETKGHVPYLLDVQADLLSDLATRVVVPLFSQSAFPMPARHLNPVFSIGHETVVMATQELAGVPCQSLGIKVTDLCHSREEIVAALDFLLTGF